MRGLCVTAVSVLYCADCPVRAQGFCFLTSPGSTDPQSCAQLSEEKSGPGACRVGIYPVSHLASLLTGFCCFVLFRFFALFSLSTRDVPSHSLSSCVCLFSLGNSPNLYSLFSKLECHDYPGNRQEGQAQCGKV